LQLQAEFGEERGRGVKVIDDDADISALVGLRLELDGHVVSVEPDGTSGLARAQQEKVHKRKNKTKETR